jgi:hypothetical protein
MDSTILIAMQYYMVNYSYTYLPIIAAAIPPEPSIKGAIDYMTNGVRRFNY